LSEFTQYGLGAGEKMIGETLAELVRKRVTALGEIEARQRVNGETDSKTTKPFDIFKSDNV